MLALKHRTTIRGCQAHPESAGQVGCSGAVFAGSRGRLAINRSDDISRLVGSGLFCRKIVEIQIYKQAAFVLVFVKRRWLRCHRTWRNEQNGSHGCGGDDSAGQPFDGEMFSRIHKYSLKNSALVHAIHA